MLPHFLVKPFVETETSVSLCIILGMYCSITYIYNVISKLFRRKLASCFASFTFKIEFED